MEVKQARLAKPTIYSRFHIDYNWWTTIDRDWRVYLLSNLCHEHQELFANQSDSELVDFIDPETAEVTKVDGLHHVLISHCARQPGFISSGMPLVDTIFRIFLANGNVPLSCVELAERSGKSADTILRMLTGLRIYKGLRPVIE